LKPAESTTSAPPNPRQLVQLAVIAAGAVLVHGYHPYVEDAEIYVPGIKKILNPALYPHSAVFFASHARMTLFPNLIAGSIRLSALPLDWALFLWHLAAVFLFLLGCWRLGRLAFRDSMAAWGGVALVASLLTLPVAGTRLYIMDQYLNPRSLSSAAVLFIIVNVLGRRFLRAGLWAAFTASIHPLMVVFGGMYAFLLLWYARKPAGTRRPQAAMVIAMVLPLWILPPVTDGYRELFATRPYFFLLRWEWYEWLGLVAPLAIVWWFARLAERQDLPELRAMCRALIAFSLIFFAAAVVVTVPPSLLGLVMLQPLRYLHLVYVLMFLFTGGWLARYVLLNHWWRWGLLFVPLCLAMWYAQRQQFPATPHMEWPWALARNSWVETFSWIRQNTPPEAYFVLDPRYMAAPGEDYHGFRAIAERSKLADATKDASAMTMFPAEAQRVHEQVRALDGWQNFQAADFRRLKQQFGVDWAVVEGQVVSGLFCPYENQGLRVCRIE
jgi:hypothetical protein